MISDFNSYCIKTFSKVRPCSTFLSIKNYKNNFGEISDFGVCFNINYLNAVEKSKQIVNNTNYLNNSEFSIEDFNLAKDELLDSFAETLSGQPNQLYTCHGVYEDVVDASGVRLGGVRLHSEQNILHIHALKFRKKILVPGIKKSSNSEAKTLAKKYLRNQTPLKNWVQFKLYPGRFDKLVVENMKIDG